MAGRTESFRLSPLARRDLEGIWRFTAERWSPEQAEAYHRGIVTAVERLSDGTVAGRPVDVRPGYFKYGVGAHLVFYKLSGTTLEVIRIRHRRMDVDRHL